MNLKPTALALAALTLAACAKTEAPAPAAAVSAPAADAPATVVANSNAGIESCAKAALAQAPGELLQATLKSEPEGRVWEFEIRQADGKLFDIECSDSAGTIVETETRVASAADPEFAAIAKIDEATARAKALAAKAGTVERVEFELEAEGKASYEYDIKTADGDYRVEVDAASGEVVETSAELLEIGGI
ncbi:MAG: peptidase [Xanthomonadaceae bacterium]|nr:peptidase [Xanthomonadaceae bacterium]